MQNGRAAALCMRSIRLWQLINIWIRSLSPRLLIRENNNWVLPASRWSALHTIVSARPSNVWQLLLCCLLLCTQLHTGIGTQLLWWSHLVYVRVYIVRVYSDAETFCNLQMYKSIGIRIRRTEEKTQAFRVFAFGQRKGAVFGSHTIKCHMNTHIIPVYLLLYYPYSIFYVSHAGTDFLTKHTPSYSYFRDHFDKTYAWCEHRQRFVGPTCSIQSGAAALINYSTASCRARCVSCVVCRPTLGVLYFNPDINHPRACGCVP